MFEHLRSKNLSAHPRIRVGIILPIGTCLDLDAKGWAQESNACPYCLVVDGIGLLTFYQSRDKDMGSS